MNPGKSIRKSSITTGLVLLATLLTTAQVASARTELLRWTHPSAQDITRFEALVGTSPQVYGTPISLGRPQPDGQGVFSASIDVGDDVDIYVAVRAIDSSGQASVPSNERFRPGQSSGGEPGGDG
ncbi:MAG: hypothetical protein JRE21_01410, partial [Deltaproteobacteria bacterium]|nr:hypothetical protein [Deltaproteobacteria bacterium]